MVDRALLLHLVGDHLVALVEKQDAELLLGLEAHGGPAIVEDLLPGRQDRPLQHLALNETQGGGAHQLDLGGGRLAEPRHLLEQILRGVHRLGEGAEAGKNRLGEGLRVAARHGAEQHQLQQLVVGQGVRPALAKALPEPFAMAEIMRLGDVLEAHVAFAGG